MSPLLIIAGAGSGKTNTLAHRVAHLVHEGADPHRVLLLTFSRRAAAELERRAGRALSALLDARGNGQHVSLPWAGTFHSVGARLLREYAGRVGLVTGFTIHDRPDSEDLMAVVRQEMKVDVTKKRFPGSAACVAIYSRVVNAETVLRDVLREDLSQTYTVSVGQGGPGLPQRGGSYMRVSFGAAPESASGPRRTP